jgi:hypothetical protein
MADPVRLTAAASKIAGGFVEKTINETPTGSPDKGTGFLFWGWIIVAILNFGMVTAALALFAP